MRYHRRIGRGVRLLQATALAVVFSGLAVAVALSHPGARDAKVEWQAARSPFRLSFSAGRVPLTAEALGAPGAGPRLGYVLADRSRHTLTTLIRTTNQPAGTTFHVATDEPGRSATVAVAHTRNGASVSLSLHPADGVVETFEAFTARPGEHFLGGGERPGPLDLRGQALAVKTSFDCENTMPAPFFVSSAGYGVALASSAVSGLAFPGADPASECTGASKPPCPLAPGRNVVQICTKSASLEYDLFAGPPRKVVSAYARMIGLPSLPPVSQFALVKWRDVVGGPADLFEDADRLRALDIPLGWILLDNPWESSGCYGQMVFDAKHFPDPQTMIQQLHARGVRFMLWVSPLVRGQWCPPPQYPSNVLFGSGNKRTIDLTDPATRSSFETHLRGLISLGVDGFKADRGDEIDLEGSQLAGGSGTTLHNLYPLLFAKAVASAVSAAGRAGDFATLFRAGAPGSSATVPGFWAGDQDGTFEGLVRAIHSGLSAGVAGYPIWGSDIGGYRSDQLTPEIFVRWAQFSAISPIFEVGGTGKNSTFWEFDPQTVSYFRDAAVLHYELFPYLYALAGIAHRSGLPILRPLALNYPADPQAWLYDTEALVGDDLLAVPVTTATPSGGTTRARVYLPAGSWIDLATGVTRRGGGTAFLRPTPLAELPLYLRAGAVIPFAMRTPLLWPKPWPTDALQLPGRAGWLYAPGQGTAQAAVQGYGIFRAATRGATVNVRLLRAPAQTAVLVAGRGTPEAVRIDGRPMQRARSVAALRQAATGWALTRLPFPGVVLKLAPQGGSSRVDLVLRRPLRAHQRSALARR